MVGNCVDVLVVSIGQRRLRGGGERPPVPRSHDRQVIGKSSLCDEKLKAPFDPRAS